MDIDRPDEPLEAEIEELNGSVLVLSVPNSSVRFALRRRDKDSPFEGALGGRYFVFDPNES
jgi:hypothetical protein